MKKSILFLAFCLLSIIYIQAQINPVKWSFDAKEITATEYEITFTAAVKDGWSIYSQHTDPSGPVPTSFNFDKNTNIEFVDKPEEKGKKKEGFDELFGVNVIKFSGDVVFTQKIKVKDNSESVTGYLEFMCCDNEKCLPPKEVDFNIALK